MRPDPRGLEWFFRPRSVAVIGASTRPGKVGHECLRSLVESGFPGPIYPVNPRAGEVLGLRCYPSVLDVPGRVDLAVLAVPARAVPEVVRQCAEKGVRAVVVISGGFREAGPEGERLQRELLEAARSAGIRVIGPNCIGVFDARSRVDTTFQSRERMGRPGPGPAAFMSQSGTFAAAFIDLAAEEGLGVSLVASLGNRADVDEADLLAYLAEDEGTRVVGAYIESFTDGRKLMRAVRGCPKPVVVFKAGRTSAGASAAVSHTGRMAGRHEVASSALRQAGAMLVGSFTELYGAVKAIAKQPPAGPGGVAMVTNGAGPCVAAADELSEAGVPLARLSEETRGRLRSSLPPYALVGGSVVDLTGSATARDYLAAVEALAEAPEVGLIGVFVVFQDTPLEDEFAELLPRVDAGKPVLVYAVGGPYTREKRLTLERAGVPAYSGVREFSAAARALYEARGKAL